MSDDYGFEELDSAVFHEIDNVEARHFASGSSLPSHASKSPSNPPETICLLSSPEPEPVPSRSSFVHEHSRRASGSGGGPSSLNSAATTARVAPESWRNAASGGSGRPVAAADTSMEVDEFDFDDDILAAVAQIEEAYNKDPVAWKPPPLTRQTTLQGQIVQQTKTLGPSGSSFHRFGRKASKTKIWDRTEFSKTGMKSKSKKGKGKGKAKGDFDDMEEDEEGIEFEQFPAPFVSLGPPPPMKLLIDHSAAKEWIYPLNRPKRDYQFNIVRNSLFENSLVALPTGLGKTFIAGVIMLNYYRWFPNGKVVFVAPTKPLVAQQIEACHETCGIPGSDAALLTGEIPKPARARQWSSKRVFYMTPQTLMNDLIAETCDVSDIVLLVVDEAHKATGDYAYSQVVRFLMAKNPHFRLLALTATPGGKPEAVQAVVDALHISHIEIRNEESLDLRQYMHKKNLVHTVVPMGGGIIKIQGLLAQVMQKEVDKLSKAGIMQVQDVVRLHSFRCQSVMNDLGKSPEGRSTRWAFPTLKLLGTLARSMGYLMEQSIAMCYSSLKDNLGGDGEEHHGGGDDDLPPTKKKPTKKPPKKSQIEMNFALKKLMQEMETQKAARGGHFPSHPKLDKLLELALDHFTGHAAGEDTRVMVFTTFRACVEEIVEVLNGHSPMLRATRFVGQASDKAGKKGIGQKEQMEIIKQFKEGVYNVLVATSIGEEGLDIGEVDLIICYDSQKTPIRMLQRIGRTGRKRDGRIEVLSAAGREELNYQKADDSYKEVQDSIVRGEDLELYADVERLLPEELKPACVEKEMPIEPYAGGKADKPKAGEKKVSKTVKAKTKKTAGMNAVPIPDGAARGFVPVNELMQMKRKGKQKAKVEDDDDDDDARPPPSKPKAKVSKPKPAAAIGFSSAKELARMALDDSDSEPSVKAKPKAKPPPRKKAMPSPIEILDSPDVSTKKKVPPPPPPKATNMSWLLSDDDYDQPKLPKVPKMKPLSRQPPASSSSTFAPPPTYTRPFSSPSPPPPSLPRRPLVHVSSPVNGGDSPGPNASFEIAAPGKRRAASRMVVDLSSPDVSAAAPRRLKRGVSKEDDEPEQEDEQPRRKRSKNTKFLSRINNAMFEMEADHSGDELSAGASSDGQPEDEYDRSFVNDGCVTQAPPGYDQQAIYRRGLMSTQAPDGNGPSFARSRVRGGMFGVASVDELARLRKRRHRVGIVGSSSPPRDEDDDYEMGSFVVEDDDGILEVEASSEM